LEVTFFRGAGEVLQGSLVRLVSLWWEFPPRLDSKNNILSGRLQQFFVFQNEEFYSALIEIRYGLDITRLFDFIFHFYKVLCHSDAPVPAALSSNS